MIGCGSVRWVALFLAMLWLGCESQGPLPSRTSFSGTPGKARSKETGRFAWRSENSWTGTSGDPERS